MKPESVIPKEWWSARELAGLPGMPGTDRAIQIGAKKNSWQSRPRAGRGGGLEYHRDSLPQRTRKHLEEKFIHELLQAPDGTANLTVSSSSAPATSLPATEFFSAAHAAEVSSYNREALWAAFERKPERTKNRAKQMLRALDTALTLMANNVGRTRALAEAAAAHGITAARVRRWWKDVRGRDRADWLPLLAPGYAGRTAVAECSPEAWDYFKADYLRTEEPAAAACYERMRRAAKVHGWTIPCVRTLERRIEREIPRPVLILAREGTEALKRAYPAQQRDRSVFDALEGVNADGHRFDVFVRWPDGEVWRPCMVAWQDLLSGKILARRVDKTENSDAVRLSFGDLVERYGIPGGAWLDNGRAWASKWMTGGMPNRYRFKVLEEEPVGILTLLLGDDNIHWTTPYHGQAKPIERAFRDFCEYVAKHPAFAGAYTGNKPDAKPENYGSRAVPLEQFLQILDQEIAAHNARPGRRGGVCAGRSFDQVFAESYERAPIRKATAEQRRLWLLAAESASSKQDGTVTLAADRRNRYSSPELADHAGEDLVVRFDPQTLHERVYVYTTDGRFLAEAQCIEAAGFNDTEAAREHSRARNQWKRAARAQLDAERRMSALEAAKLLPQVEPAEVPDARVVRPARPSLRVEAPKAAPLDEATRAIQAQMIAAQERPPEPREEEETEEMRYARAAAIERRVAGAEAISASDAAWFERYSSSIEYRAQKRFREAFQLDREDE